MPPQQPPPQRQGPQPQSGGPIHAVKCPHCGFAQDFRELNLGDGGTQIYRGAEMSCDACDMMFVVSSVQKVTFVTLKPLMKRAPNSNLPPGGRRMLRG